MSWTRQASLINGPDRATYEDDKKFLEDTYKFVQENFKPGTWLTQEFDGELVGHNLITDEASLKQYQEERGDLYEFNPFPYADEKNKAFLLQQIQEDFKETDQ